MVVEGDFFTMKKKSEISVMNGICRAGGRLAKAEGRRPDASAGRPCRPSRTLLAKSGQKKRIFCYEMYFKHDLPHDVGLKSLYMQCLFTSDFNC